MMELDWGVGQIPDAVERLKGIAEEMRDDLGDNLTGRKPTGARPHGTVKKN